MLRFENEFSSDSGLILSETLYEKKREIVSADCETEEFD